jgi:uncharacterized Zn finger protein
MEVRCYRCPECGSENVNSTVRTIDSTYCRCRDCQHIWHEERREPPSPSEHKRRKTDT